MSWLQGLILGLIQGLAEFLPISSSGHLTIGQELFSLGGEDNLYFDILVHFATVLSTVIVFRKPIAGLIKGFFSRQRSEERVYVFKIFVSMIPVLIVGLFLKDYIEKLFQTSHIKAVTGNGLLIVGAMLIVTAALLWLSERIALKYLKYTGEGKEISYWKAFIIGIAQAVAVLPGLSRSGSTIATGLILKVKKSSVAQFSFLMVIIPIVGEALLSIYKSMKETDVTMCVSGNCGVVPLLVGFLAAFFAGLFACRWMVALVKKMRLTGFALYCCIAGALCIILPYIV